jgi:recombination endonuclease VII
MSGTCTLDFCDETIRAKGLCTFHYMRRARGAPLVPRDWRDTQDRTCCTDGCERVARRRGLCDAHYQADRYVPAAPQDPARFGPCAVEGCDGLRTTATGRPYCRTHRRWDTHLRHWYGLSIERYDALLAEQGGGCAICGRTERLHVDHDHESGVVRGILCGGCNRALGCMDDDPERLVAAARYLTH